MFIGIVSDSHDNLPAIRKAVKLFNDRGVEIVLHAVDYISPFAVKEFSNLSCELWGVFGNNDGEKEGVKKAVEDFGTIEDSPVTLELDGRKIHLTHKPVKDYFADLFDVAIYGHTHEPRVEKREGSLIINSGECSGWLNGRKTVAIADLERMEAEIVDLD
jgi:hypothetical protein